MHSMPEMIELYERFHDKGLAIIGVHVDVDGEVDTAAKLDKKLALHKKNIWKDKDIPFPVALVSGKEVVEGEHRARGRAAQQYGITGYPTTVLIDRDGKVMGPLNAAGFKEAAEKIEKLLNEKK
jgi:cytochrome oxidase Cu insertion factor (SCO1/SenC/PrrC family)